MGEIGGWDHDVVGGLVLSIACVWAGAAALSDLGAWAFRRLRERGRIAVLTAKITWSRTLSFVGIGFVLASAPTVVAARSGPPIRRVVHMSESSRSQAGGPPPPQSPARDRGILRVHPAIHRGAGETIAIDGPLFDRLGRRLGRERTIDLDPARGRERAMRMHPAGKGLVGNGRRASGGDRSAGGSHSHPMAEGSTDSEEGTPRHHVVREGESLWSIAESVLETKDLRRVARYWPAIHRANRAVVGRDPSRLFPGQRLVLPPEDGV